MRQLVFFAASALFVVAACNAILGNEEEITFVDDDAGGTDATSTADRDAGPPADAGQDSGRVGDADASSNDMVLVTTSGPSFFIDVHEGTYAQFIAFKEKVAVAGNDAGFPSVCAFKSGIISNGCNTTDDGGAAVGCVDWCDAFAYCAAAGKRLCGRIGGGALVTEQEAAEGITSEWARACANDPVATRYPYGVSPDASFCNTSEGALGRSVPPGAFPACVGGVAALFDMSGNVAEYSNSCLGDASPGDICLVHGGGYDMPVSNSRCDSTGTIGRNYNGAPHIGIRCCKDP